MEDQGTILLLENVDDDVFMFRRALAALRYRGIVRVVSSLAEARDYMLGRGSFCDRGYFQLPNLIVCDFGLGAERGSDFIRWLRGYEKFAAIPVIFFSGMLAAADLAAAVREFNIPLLRKDVDFHANTETVKQMLGYMQVRIAGPAPRSEA